LPPTVGSICESSCHSLNELIIISLLILVSPRLRAPLLNVARNSEPSSSSAVRRRLTAALQMANRIALSLYPATAVGSDPQPCLLAAAFHFARLLGTVVVDSALFHIVGPSREIHSSPNVVVRYGIQRCCAITAGSVSLYFPNVSVRADPGDTGILCESLGRAKGSNTFR
jgi:hypothetical protein